MFELYEKVTVNTNGLSGTIIDIDETGSEPLYTIESYTETEDEYGTLYPLFYCKASEMKKVLSA